jgi:SPP1 gp7 family putative phage head morphogenesis protein
MVADVARRDEKFWFDKSREMGNLLKTDFARGPLGVAARERVYEAASLISSLPLEAAQRVEKYSIEFMTRGIRANEFAKRIMNTGEVTKSRANLIARTETSRTAGILQQVRAESVGSEGYIWRTSMDIDVRDRHRKLEGKFFRWDDPPVTGENGERSHPGGIYNCRCWAEVVLPGERHPAVGRKRRVTNASPTRASRFRAEPVDE